MFFFSVPTYISPWTKRREFCRNIETTKRFDKRQKCWLYQTVEESSSQQNSSIAVHVLFAVEVVTLWTLYELLCSMSFVHQILFFQLGFPIFDINLNHCFILLIATPRLSCQTRKFGQHTYDPIQNNNL